MAQPPKKANRPPNPGVLTRRVTFVAFSRNSPIVRATLAFMAVVLGIAIIRWLPCGPDTNSPDAPSPEDLEAVCDAHGHLQLLASYPDDPITAFEILELGPHARPFFPRKASLPRPEMWHDEIYGAVMARYTPMMEAMGLYNGRGIKAHDKQYVIALTTSADLLLKDGPRRYYLDTVLPMLERAIQGQPRRCVWPSVSEFNHNLCAATWRGTDMAYLLRDRHISRDHRCDDRFGIRGWLERLVVACGFSWARWEGDGPGY